ncbi:class I SAM-dependent methyltransferase [Paenibacillus sp. KQZ6P-2]|uniref:Class I SAM-dependent methyltransferase n=1 Tax=Paenibacillus mangrovi TaxID=2931978 RepID=A0A9X1WLI9_9BACL|nr:class I SAM-dependent methyltransferase [Paenibacillus mangrovi]MCJ8010881.1 class I SAM-dependent methyltransferase [Paenibacillus mangrovi]
MAETMWDEQFGYLASTRGLYYNDDYLEFLVRTVWKMDKPLRIVDYGCGFGYLGLKLLPLLPEGSTYTGMDSSPELIKQAEEIFAKLPYEVNFILTDITRNTVEQQYDVAVCHAFLLHMEEPVAMLQKMVASVVNGGRIICFEPHWIMNMAGYSYEAHGMAELVPLGSLQKLYEWKREREGKDGNIGIRLPFYFSQLGLKQIECRVSDKVNFLNPAEEMTESEDLYAKLKAEGIGHPPNNNQDEWAQSLIKRGLTSDEAHRQYEAEHRMSQLFRPESCFAYAPGMKITFGTVSR